MKKLYLFRKFFLYIVLLVVLLLFLSVFSVPYIAQSKIINDATTDAVTGSIDYNASKLRKYDEYADSYFCIYSNTHVNKAEIQNYDIEHIFARDWVKSESNELRAKVANDAFNVRVSDKLTNNTRGNAYFSSVDKSSSNIVYDSYGNVSGWLDSNRNLFEPRDESKGDVARAILYMILKYNLEYPYLREMIAWSELDIPDEHELKHYDTAYELCGYSNLLISKPSFSKYCYW